jgi:hypothetical protein
MNHTRLLNGLALLFMLASVIAPVVIVSTPTPASAQRALPSNCSAGLGNIAVCYYIKAASCVGWKCLVVGITLALPEFPW